MENTMDKLIAKMERARARLNTSLDKVAPQADIYPTWKLKQVLDHITGWDELVVDSLQRYLKGESPGVKVRGIDQYNEGSVETRKAISLEQSRQAYDAARRDVLNILHSLPAEMIGREYKAPWGGTCTIPEIMKIFISHELEHARQIDGILSSASPVG